MTIPQPLSATECPLLPPDSPLLEVFNGLAREVADRYSQDADILRWGRFPAIVQGLSEVRTTLTRLYYRAALGGPPQAGKSTTFNRVLGVRADGAPALIGTGTATTAAATRVTRSRTGADTLSLLYMTPPQYRHLVEKLCEDLGLDASRPAAELLKQCRGAAAGHVEGGTEKSLQSTYRSLELLLQSGQRFPGYLTEPPRVEPASYTDRLALLNHSAALGREPEPGPGSLLREARIGLANALLPLTLELIDLPGIGGHRRSDTFVTLSFLGELDALLCFVPVDRHTDEGVEGLLRVVSEFFQGDLKGRVFVVFTKTDALTRAHLTSAKSVADNVLDFLGRHGIPASQVFFVSNKLHEELAELPEAERPAAAARRFDQPADRPVPPAFAANPHLEAAFRHLLPDGGIARLREFLTQDLPGRVGEEIRRGATRRLAGLADDFAAESARWDLLFRRSVDGVRKVQRCRQMVLGQLLGLNDPRRRRRLLDPLGLSCARQLGEGFDAECLPEDYLSLFSREQLSDEFRRQAGVLEEEFHRLLGLLVLDPLYAALGSEFETLPQVPVARQASVQEAWEQFRQEDVADRAWRQARMPTFLTGDLLTREAPAGRDGGLNGRSYRALMHSKIRTAVFQGTHEVRMRVEFRLRALEAELSGLQNPGPAATGALTVGAPPPLAVTESPPQ